MSDTTYHSAYDDLLIAKATILHLEDEIKRLHALINTMAQDLDEVR